MSRSSYRIPQGYTPGTLLFQAITGHSHEDSDAACLSSFTPPLDPHRQMPMSQYFEDDSASHEQRSRGFNALADLREALPEENNIVHQQEWVYGYWFKVKYMRRLAERHKLDWQKHGSKLVNKFVTSLAYSTGIFFSAHAAIYQGQPALILAFAEDDNRRRLEHIEFSESEIDKIRRGIGLPAGTKPRWYELSGKGTDPDEEIESEDESFPDETD